MGKQFTVAKDFMDVRYSLNNPKNYSAGDTVVITDAEYAALSTSLTRTIAAGSVTTVTDPVYPEYPFPEVGLGMPIYLRWDGSNYQPSTLKSAVDRPKVFVGPTDPNGFSGVTLSTFDTWNQTT